MAPRAARSSSTATGWPLRSTRSARSERHTAPHCTRLQQAAIDRGERLREELLHEVAIIAKQ